MGDDVLVGFSCGDGFSCAAGGVEVVADCLAVLGLALELVIDVEGAG